MPKGFIYFNIQRRLERVIPDENIFMLEIFERGAGYIAVDDISKALRRSAKIKDHE